MLMYDGVNYLAGWRNGCTAPVQADKQDMKWAAAGSLQRAYDTFQQKPSVGPEGNQLG